MRAKNKAKPKVEYRINLDLTSKGKQRLDSLVERTEESKAGVIRTALRLYEHLMVSHGSGYKVFIGCDRESAVEQVFFFGV